MVILEAAVLLHDFGKIGIDEELLLKAGKLTKKEKTEIENHVLRGYYILLGFQETEFDPQIVQAFIDILDR